MYVVSGCFFVRAVICQGILNSENLETKDLKGTTALHNPTSPKQPLLSIPYYSIFSTLDYYLTNKIDFHKSPLELLYFYEQRFLTWTIG